MDLVDRLLIVWIFLGFVLRVLLLLYTKGTNDIIAWEEFASASISLSIRGVYQMFDGVDGRLLMNNPPLAGILSSWCLYVSRIFNIPFWIAFKILQALSDACSVLILGRIVFNQSRSRRAARLAMAIYSLSPVSILISGYHGHTDALCALGVVASALALQSRRWFWAGCALAFSIHIKVIPILFAPFFLLASKGVKEGSSFVAGLSLGVLPMALFLASDMQAIMNIFGYQSNAEPWGLRALLITLLPVELAGDNMARGVALSAFLAVLARCVWLAFKNRRGLHPAEALFIPTAAFVFLASGFGVQYCIYPLAGAILYAPRHAFAWSLITGTFLLSVYLQWIVSWYPVTGFHTGPFAFYAPVICGLISWVMLGKLLIKALMRP